MTTKLRMILLITFAFAGLGSAVYAETAAASFGLVPDSVDATVFDETGSFAPQAAAHPFGVETQFTIKSVPDPSFPGHEAPDGSNLRQVTVEAPPGLIGNPTAIPRCDLTLFLEAGNGSLGELGGAKSCPDSTQVGVEKTDADIALFGPRQKYTGPIWNLTPLPGQPALFGFYVFFVPVLAIPTIRSDGDYGIDFNVVNIDESVPIFGNEFTFWGVPSAKIHDTERGFRNGGWQQASCGDGRRLTKAEIKEAEEHGEEKILLCPSGAPEKAFLTTPTDCQHGPFKLTLEVLSWFGDRDSESILTHDDEGNPAGVSRCDRVRFEPEIAAQPSTDKTASPSGLDFEMQIPEDGLLNPVGLAQANLKKAVVTLPEGFTLNPSAGEGLGYCTEADFAREEFGTEPGQGCPNASKLGTVQIESPLLDKGELAEGSLYIGQPNDPTKPGEENPFDSLVSMYLVARVPERGVIIKTAGKVDLDPATGQITTTFDNLPQLPFSSFKLHFREGGRAPLVTPSSCGDKQTEAKLYPYSDPNQATEVSSVSLIRAGADGGPCPSGGLPPFKPNLIAGSLNNAAGKYTPFSVRLFRSDQEQEITHFSIKLPPGLVGKLAGIPFCSDAAIAQAKAREHIGGGREEQLNPSCPAASKIGRTLVGAGSGSILTYVPGKVYLAGSYHGSPVSIVAITSGVVGPFDIGTIAVREALRVNPETAEVFIDATGSDPIPHIVDGVATHIRDLRVYVDRPEFTLNPTDCTKTSTASTVLGSGLDFVSEADDNPITVSSPFQAADCAALGFKPKLKMFLKGGTRRNQVPALRAVLNARPGDANIAGAEVVLPHSEFLDQGHIRTVCTRVQFNQGAGNGAGCPAGSVYGRARAITPLLSEPLEGPVYLRSNGGERSLPDLVAALHGQEIDVDLVGYIDAVVSKNKHGEVISRIRNRFAAVPDAPVTKFVLEMQGGKKGLLINSTDLCGEKHRAEANFSAQNGREKDLRPLLQVQCGKKKGRAR